MSLGVDIKVYVKGSYALQGYITRKPSYQGQFCNFGYGVFSILGKRSKIAGASGVHLTNEEIKKLNNSGEIHFRPEYPVW